MHWCFALFPSLADKFAMLYLTKRFLCLFQINDWPDLKYRGVLWDVSTGRVPTLVGKLSRSVMRIFAMSAVSR